MAAPHLLQFLLSCLMHWGGEGTDKLSMKLYIRHCDSLLQLLSWIRFNLLVAELDGTNFDNLLVTD